MKLRIQKWGNSAAVRLPGSMLSHLDATIGDAFEVDLSARAATLRVARRHYKLADLLAQCNRDAAPPELDWWERSAPAGQELW